MAASIAVTAAPRPPVVPARVWGLAACGGLAFAAVVALVTFGTIAFGMIVFLGLAAAALLLPRGLSFALLAVGIAIEPGAVDFTGPLSDALYQLPAPIAESAPLTVSPLELLIVIATVGVLLRRRGPAEGRLPALVWAAPVAILVGTAYGWQQGGEMNLAWNEMRGLVYAALAFVIAVRIGGSHGRALGMVVVGSTFVLALIVLARHLWFVEIQHTAITSEFLYAHEDAIFLGIGLIAGVLLFLHAKGKGARSLYAFHSTIVLLAMMASGRRSAIMVLIVGALVLAWLLFPRRPKLVLGIVVPALAVAAVYGAAYWESDAGVFAQPARAVRSQIDPSERDRLSDTYRDDERENVEATLQAHPWLGVGFGNEFEQNAVELTDFGFWPLQFHTPHQNVLWLFLKMGLLGGAMLLTLWTIALRRCLWAVRDSRAGPIPVVPLVLAATLLMYIFFATVDTSLVTSRSAIPLAIAMAMALSLPAAGSTPPGESKQAGLARLRGVAAP